jgi:hypothetical protein
MLGVVSEQFPKGGALTLNAIAGVGMLGVGVVGAAFLGNVQDKEIDQQLLAKDPGLHQRVAGEEKLSIFGSYRTIDSQKLQQATGPEKETILGLQEGAKLGALSSVAILPIVMLVSYLILIFYFRSRGGYKAESLDAESG